MLFESFIVKKIKKTYPSKFDLFQFFSQKCSTCLKVLIHIVFFDVYAPAVPKC